MSLDQPQNPFGVSLPPGSAAQSKSMGRGGEMYALEDHGKYYAGSYYNRCFAFNRTAVTVPAIAGTLVSVFSLYNPPNSTVNLEIIDTDIGIVLATTVVDTVGLYWQAPTLASLATLTTIAVFGTDWFASNLSSSAGMGAPYRALTHSGTPVRVDIIGQFGAATASNDVPLHKEFNGLMLLPPGHVLSVAMSTTVGTTSGLDLGIRWMEVATT